MNTAGGYGKKMSSTLLSYKGNFCLDEYLSARMLERRVIYLNDEIGCYEGANLTRQLELLSTKVEPVTLLLSSPGGLLDDGFTIIRAIRAAQAKGVKVTGEVRGYAYSMAALILQVCDYRKAAPEDTIMIHGASGIFAGDIKYRETELDLTKTKMDIQARLIADRNTSDEPTYREIEYWRTVLDDDHPTYFFGKEALEQGLIDAIVEY